MAYMQLGFLPLSAGSKCVLDLNLELKAYRIAINRHFENFGAIQNKN